MDIDPSSQFKPHENSVLYGQIPTMAKFYGFYTLILNISHMVLITIQYDVGGKSHAIFRLASLFSCRI